MTPVITSGTSSGMTAPDDPAATWLARHGDELIAFRRQLHAHPELGREEHGTTDLVANRLSAEGLNPRLLPVGSGLWCDIGGDGDGGGQPPEVLLRADLDALPLDDEKDVPYRSTVPGVCHACGHDVHTSVLLGAGLALAELAERDGLPGRVRLVFQPAEEMMPGGALDVLRAGLVTGGRYVFALHCDPSIEVGTVGLKVGPITAAADKIDLHLSGPGGHTSRPQNTVDLINALSRVVADLPAALTRVIDPRSAMTLVWGMISAGSAPNAIPRTGLAKGTLRMLDHEAWQVAPEVVHRLATELAAPYGATARVDYHRGVPPVVNSGSAVAVLQAAAHRALPAGAVVPTRQSLGGEDFGWYLEHVPGAMARLGVRPAGGAAYDLHQGGFDVDEDCIAVGVRLMVATALEALRD
ncbi:MAG TPA: amidohydrolase [Frankiaceae bacterium]|nr:amidohydrolase [Frankiaceae bacterium]